MFLVCVKFMFFCFLTDLYTNVVIFQKKVVRLVDRDGGAGGQWRTADCPAAAAGATTQGAGAE